MRLCTLCRVHPVLSTGMNDQLCNNCIGKYRHIVGSVVHYHTPSGASQGRDARWNRDQGQYFQSFGPHPFGTLVPHTIQSYPGEIVGASIATNDSVTVGLNQTDQQGQQIDAAFSNCPSGDPTIIAQWKAFYAGYLSFSNSSHAFLKNTTAQLMTTPLYLYQLQQIDNSLQSYVSQMNTWATTANKICGGAATQNIPSQGITSTLSSITKNLTTLVILAAVVIGGIYGLSLYEEYKHV